MKNKVLKQSYESMGNNSIIVELEIEKKIPVLWVCLTDFNPYKRIIKKYDMRTKKNWNDNNFLFYLDKIIKNDTVKSSKI